MHRWSVQFPSKGPSVQSFVFEAERKRCVILPFSTSICTIYSLPPQTIEESCSRNFLRLKFTNKSSWKGVTCSNTAKMDKMHSTGPHIVCLVSRMSTRTKNSCDTQVSPNRQNNVLINKIFRYEQNYETLPKSLTRHLCAICIRTPTR